MRHSPTFTTIAVLSLALGIGANTAIFTLINTLVLRELPVREPERLVQLSVVRRDQKIPFSYPTFRELERGQRVFAGIIGWSYPGPSNAEVNGVHLQAVVNKVTGNYYSELGVVPLLGRVIAPEDVNASPVAVLSYEFWQRRFAGTPDVVGKQIRVEAQNFTIIGVTRKWFTGMTIGYGPDVTVPIKSSDSRAMLWVNLTGRLKKGITVTQARAQLESIWPAALLATAPTETPGPRRQSFLSMRLDVAPVANGLARELRDQFTRPLYALLAITGLILALACVNLANLMLARGAARSHSASLRMALGAGRWPLVREVFAESLALSIAGALLGIGLAWWGSRLLVNLMMHELLTLDLRPDWRVLLLAAAMTVLTSIICGIAPAWRVSGQDPADVLRRNIRTLGGAVGRTGQALMLVQVALSLVLLLGAGLFVRSFRNLCTVETGFDDRVLSINLNPRPGGYRNLNLGNYRRQLIERFARIPGVLSAGLSDFPGPGQSGWKEMVSSTTAIFDPNAGVMTESLMVSPGFFRTLGIRLLLGRDLDWTDDEGHPHVAVVSSSLARRLFPSGNAIGRHIRFGFMPEHQDLEVVGIVSTARLFDPRDSSAPALYLSFLQYPKWSERGNLFLRSVTPDTVARAVEHEIDSLGHEYVVQSRTLAQSMSQALTTDRVVALLAGFFAVLALLLASIGLYGLTSYAIARRTREIGIRMALGAQLSTVLWGVLRGALTLTLAGIALGIPCALVVTRLIAGMLFGIAPGDLPTAVCVSVLLIAVALLASYLPARRASRIDPVVALRTE